MPAQVRSRGVDGSDHAGAHVVTGGFGDELVDGLPGRTTQRTEQLAAMKEERSQELRHGEGPEMMTHIFGDFFPQESSEHGSSLGRTGRAKAATGTGEGQQVLVLAGVTEDAGEAVLEVAAVEEGIDDAVEETAPATIGRLEALLPPLLDFLVALPHQAVEG